MSSVCSLSGSIWSVLLHLDLFIIHIYLCWYIYLHLNALYLVDSTDQYIECIHHHIHFYKSMCNVMYIFWWWMLKWIKLLYCEIMLLLGCYHCTSVGVFRGKVPLCWWGWLVNTLNMKYYILSSEYVYYSNRISMSSSKMYFIICAIVFSSRFAFQIYHQLLSVISWLLVWFNSYIHERNVWMKLKWLTVVCVSVAGV